MKLRNKTALVTGASTGIGRAVSIDLAGQGAFVYLVARRKDELDKTKKLIKEVGGRSEVILVDLTDYQEIERLTRLLNKKKRIVNILFFAADVWHLDDRQYFETDLENIPDELITNSLDVGLKAPLLLTKALYPKIKKWGRIISMSGSFSPGEVGCLPQYVTKKGIENFVKQLALELDDTGIKVHAISPWYVLTEAVQKLLPDLKDEAMQPEEISEFVLKLCKDKVGESTGKLWHLRKGKKVKTEDL